MPIGTISTITRIEHLTEYWIDRFETNMDTLGFKFVGGYDDPIKTAYPAIVVGSGSSSKEVHATHVYLHHFSVDFYICHAEASQNHRKRSLENLKQVSKTVDFLEANKTLDDKIIFGYVTNERPGVLQPRSTPTRFLISTIITYQAILETVFE